MISVVLYGRNDSYGYNLHKRAALSFNCIAEILNDPNDEILFVDYNTPDDFPTFPEAIQDTLTEKARKVLRIFRVRPSIHERFKSKSRLIALEPIARNVAVRRSNPKNRWVLSTNTDMIFVPQRRGALNGIVCDLPDGLYHAPRIEIPETLWESLDRQKAKSIIETVRNWGRTLHINEIVLGADVIRYDGPGDFQLMTRSDLFEYNGFDERMLLGWHVDSNIAKRWSLIYGNVGDLGHEVYGYHCDHTRQITPAHSHTRTENDWRRFVTNVERADIPEQEKTWGCANDEIEEVRLQKNNAQIYVKALSAAIGEPLESPEFVKYTGETYDKVDYDARHLLPFLTDLFITAPKSASLAWYGGRLDILSMFADVWQKLGFTGRILIDRAFLSKKDLTKLGVHMVSARTVDAEAHAFVFDFGLLRERDRLRSANNNLKIRDGLRHAFLRTVRREQGRLESGLASRRIVALNAINNAYESFVLDYVAAGLTPFSTRMRHGFVHPVQKGIQNWLPHMAVGEAGIRLESIGANTAPVIKNAPGVIGWVAYGPYRHLFEGSYRLIVSLEAGSSDRKLSVIEPCIAIEILSGLTCLGLQVLLYKDLEKRQHECEFYVSSKIADSIAGIETRIRIIAPVSITIGALNVEKLLDSEIPKINIPSFRTVNDLLPFLYRGGIARTDAEGVAAARGEPGFVVYGPRWPLPVGCYQMLIVLERLDDDDAHHSYLGKAEVVAGDCHLASMDVYLNALSLHRSADPLDPISIPFEVPNDLTDRDLVETRFWSAGDVGFRIRSVRVEPRDPGTLQPAPIPLGSENWLVHLQLGPNAGVDDRGIQAERGKPGHVVYGPYWPLPVGCYQMLIVLERLDDDDAHHSYLGKAEVVAGDRHLASMDVYLNALSLHRSADPLDPISIPFEVPKDLTDRDLVETRFWSAGEVGFRIRSVRVEPRDPGTLQPAPMPLESENWLVHLALGPNAGVDDRGIQAEQGQRGYVVYGPCWPLKAGHYEMIVVIEPGRRPFKSVLRGLADIDIVIANGRELAASSIRYSFSDLFGLTSKRVNIPFEVPGELSNAAPVETRIWSTGFASFWIRSIVIRAIEKH